MNRNILSVLSVIFGLLLFSGTGLKAQSKLVTGRILDQETLEPIGLATIAIKGKAVGTVSNNDGVFDFYIPEKYKNDTLYISMLGYTRFQKGIRAIEPDAPLTIQLKAAPIVLNEVVIRGNSISANDIFKKAFENLTSTFPQEDFELKCMYRQIDTENGRNVLLIEAGVNIADRNYHLQKNFKLSEKVFVNIVRHSNSFFINKDENYFEKSNTLKLLLLFNFSRYNNHFVMERTNFKLDSILTHNQRTYYIISSVSEGTRLRNKFTLYIDVENFSFLKIMNESIANQGYFLQNFDVPVNPEKTKVLKLTSAIQTYQFKEYMGKMYLERAFNFSRGQIISTINKEVEWEVTDQNELTVNEVITGKRMGVPKQNIMDNSRNLKFPGSTYEPAFWTHNLINLIPLTKKQVGDLEATETLEEQFKRNGAQK